MIGLGVGIDYALFVVTRYRAQLAAGLTVPDAVARATQTSGAAVVFAGVTVTIAICGLAIAGVPIIAAVGYATSLVVALAVLAAVTLLPLSWACWVHGSTGCGCRCPVAVRARDGSAGHSASLADRGCR